MKNKRQNIQGWLRVVGLLRRACGGEEESDGSNSSRGGDGGGTTGSTAAVRSSRGGEGKGRLPPPPRLAFDLALEVCVLCARPDAGLEVLSLMRSTGLQMDLEAFKV